MLPFFRAVQNLKAFDEEVEAALAKSQLGPLREMSKMNTFPVEITFEGVKYQFSVSLAWDRRSSN